MKFDIVTMEVTNMRYDDEAYKEVFPPVESKPIVDIESPVETYTPSAQPSTTEYGKEKVVEDLVDQKEVQDGDVGTTENVV